jgi:phenylacetate-CoA ligase
MSTRTLKKLNGSFTIASILRGQKRIPYAPRKQLEVMRDQRIRYMVAYAARTVPYYRQLFAREGIDPRAIRGAADLDRLPILDKELVRAQPQLFISETAAGRNALDFLTSGSTGTPIRVYHDQRSLLANIAYGERERDPVIKGCGGSFRPKELYIGYETSTFKKVTTFYEESVLMPVRPLRMFVSLLEPLEKVVAIANAEKPDVLVGYGGWLNLFFKTIAAHNIEFHRPKMVMYMGEALPHGGRDFIEQHFGIPVISRYNAVEAFKIGFFCEQRTGFHIHEDLCHVRIVGRNGQTVESGQQGEIVVSNLVNRASVLLNYPIGDIGSVSDEKCSCGRTFKLLSELEGRVEDVLTLPDGKFVHPRAIWQVFKNDRNVLQYQLTQQEPQRFELKLVTVDEAGFHQALALALPELKNLLGRDAVIDTSRQHEFDRGEKGRKFRAVASLCNSRTSK